MPGQNEGVMVAENDGRKKEVNAGAEHSPAWYAFVCALYDAIIGAAAAWLLSAPKKD